MLLVERLASAAQVVPAHCALDAARIEFAATADTAALADFLKHGIAPGRQALRGE